MRRFLFWTTGIFSFGLAFAGVPSSAHADDASAPSPPAVRVNSVGYLPDHPKRAIIAAAGGSSFMVLRSSDGSVAFSGNLGSGIVDSTDSNGQTVYEADFDGLTELGTFTVNVPGVGSSASFVVDPDPYRDVLRTAMLGFYGWRCGTAVSFDYLGTTFGHGACHKHDASLAVLDGGSPDAFVPDAGPGPFRDGTGGWHDAGDYGKYVVNGAFAAGMLLQAFEDYGDRLAPIRLAIPESCQSQTPDFLSEVRYELEWLLKMPYAPGDGRVAEKLTSTAFDIFEMPEDDGLTRYYVPFGTKGTADYAAVLAKASRAYRPYDPAFADTLLAAAKTAYAWLLANPATVKSNETGFSTGSYEGGGDAPDRYWAAAEMWETTGDAAALADFESRAATNESAKGGPVDADFDWSNIRNLGTYTYLRSSRTGRSANTVSALTNALVMQAGALVMSAAGRPYGRAVSYYWGSNGSVVRTCMLLHVADGLQPDPAYEETCLDALAYVFGRNQYGRSQVTGIGVLPPLHPHHRPSASDGVDAPWPGLLVGGGDQSTTWEDVQTDYTVNEVAINWNAPLVYALAAQLPVPAPGADAGACTSAIADGGATADAAGNEGATPASDSGAPSVAGNGGSHSSGSSGSTSGDTDGGAGTNRPAAAASAGCGCITLGGQTAPGAWALLGGAAAFALGLVRRRSPKESGSRQ